METVTQVIELVKRMTSRERAELMRILDEEKLLSVENGDDQDTHTAKTMEARYLIDTLLKIVGEGPERGMGKGSE